MSTKAKQISVTEQVTPVIIKVGGDTTDPYNVQSDVQSPVSIESPMRFRENTPGLSWKKATSTKTGRITELSIFGDPIQDFPINPDDRLASITFRYGSAELIIQETGIPPTMVSLEFVSDQFPFRTRTEPDFNDASATFPEGVTSVLFKQGNQVIDHIRYPVPNREVTFNVNFNRNRQ